MSTRTIWKYTLSIEDTQVIPMPRGAKILTVQVQHNKACLWALVDPEAHTENRKIRLFGTGHSHPEDEFLTPKGHAAGYIGTFQIFGNLVFHVFDVT